MDKNDYTTLKPSWKICHFYIFLSISGRTRTKDKYRVVYSDHQRLELEKEFHYSRYITIRRKAELAQALSLSERQVSHVQLFVRFLTARVRLCGPKNHFFISYIFDHKYDLCRVQKITFLQ